MWCEQLCFLLRERFVFEVHELLSQPHLVTARWISALVGVGSVSLVVDHGEINVIMSQLFGAFRVGSQGLRAVQLTKNLPHLEELVV